MTGRVLERSSLRIQNRTVGTSLAVQWLKLHASTAGGMGSTSGQGTRIPHAAWCGQKKKIMTFRRSSLVT